MSYHGYVAVQGRGVVALPAELRRRHGLDQAGAQMEVTEREDGVIELRPTLAVPADQAWFWTESLPETKTEGASTGQLPTIGAAFLASRNTLEEVSGTWKEDRCASSGRPYEP